MTHHFSRSALAALGFAALFALAGCNATPAPAPQSSGQEISQQAAIDAVRALPEVREYEKTLAEAGTTAKIDAQSEDAEWLVQGYEIKDDHTATFNWYRVDKTTGRISAEF